MYTIAIRHPGGAWQYRNNGGSAREVKRVLAKRVGIPVRAIDVIPMGVSTIDCDLGKCEVKLEKI